MCNKERVCKMDIPSELSLTEIRNFMLKNGGKVTNHELVKYFKQFLTNPSTKGIYLSNTYYDYLKQKLHSFHWFFGLFYDLFDNILFKFMNNSYMGKNHNPYKHLINLYLCK